jgi:hypothetical protein
VANDDDAPEAQQRPGTHPSSPYQRTAGIDAIVGQVYYSQKSRLYKSANLL